MSNVTTASVEAAVIEYYSGKIDDLTYNVEPSLLKQIEKGKKEELNTRGASLVIRPDNNESERWGTTELADYPTPGNSPLVKTTVPFVGVTASILFSTLVIDENQNATTLGDLIQSEIDNKMEALNQSREFFLWGDGSGERARVSAFNSGTGVVTLNNSGNLYGAQMVGKGLYVEFRDSSGVLKSGGGAAYGKVSAKDNGALTITLDATVGFPNDIASGDRVYIYQSYAGAPRGFLYHIANSGAWQGIADRTVYGNTNPAIQDASSQVLSAALMDKMISGAAFKRRSMNIGNFKFYVSSQRDAYLNTGYELKTFPNTEDLKGGFTSVTHAGVKMEWHPFVQRNMVWALATEYLRYYQYAPIDWVKNAAGGIFHQLNAAQGQMHASGKACYLEGFYQYGTKQPCRLGTRLYALATTGLELGNDT
jgi:hypothetical protein